MDGPDALIVFVRAPRLGRVKTRLAAEVGDDVALAVYRRLAEHTVTVAREFDRASLRVWYTPPEAADEVAGWLGSGPVYLPQPEGDLGPRMEAAFAAAFAEGHARVVIVGSDLPSLAADTLRRAFGHLSKHEAVIGPARDGGYYLLGLRAPMPDLFRGMPWSTARVYEETVRRLLTAGVRPAVLPVMRDVDRAADLKDPSGIGTI